MEFDDPRQAGGEVGRELVVVDRLGAGDVEGVPAGLGEAAGRSRTRRSRRRSRGPCSRPPRPPRAGPAARSTGPSRPSWSRCRALHGQPAGAGRGRRSAAVPTPGSARRREPGCRRSRAAAPPPRPPRVGVERRDQRRRRSRPQLGVLVQEQAVAPARLAHQGRVVLAPCRCAARARSARIVAAAGPDRVGGAVVGGVVEDEDLALEPGRDGCARSRRGRRAGTRGRSCSRRSRRAWAPRRVTIIAPRWSAAGRPLGLHAALRPRPRRGAGSRAAPRSSC